MIKYFMAYRYSPIAFLFIFPVLLIPRYAFGEDSIQFNTDLLDVRDKQNLDVSRFSRAGFVMPGEYVLSTFVNRRSLSDKIINFYAPERDPDGSDVCISRELVSALGLKSSEVEKLKWWHNNECLDVNSLSGMTAKGNIGTGKLQINIPQAYLEYASDDWDPPSTWDDGVSGMIFDYNFSARSLHQSGGDSSRSISGNGTAGVNFGAWRMRADWQGQFDNDNKNSKSDWSWSRIYAYRAIPQLKSKLTIGEDYLDSSLFDGFRYSGLSLKSDDNMLPPSLRGYAPEVVGTAKSNAKVTISQQGRVIYETTVAPGPFRIQDLNSAINGKLDVTVAEQDGSVQKFQVDTATIPYLTRPGSVRYKMFAGKSSNMDHELRGPSFVSSEFSWGVTNGWSIFGGAILANEYNSLAVGVGRDLLSFGAMSVDVTQSKAELPDQTKEGRSYRLSYSKQFDETGSQVTFAGYRFSQRDFMSMSQFLDERLQDDEEQSNLGRGKELYTISFNQPIESLRSSLNLNYSHQTYWDRSPNDTYNLSLSSYFDVGEWKDLSLSVSLYNSEYDGSRDQGIYTSISIPWGESSIGYTNQVSHNAVSNMVSYMGTVGSDNYQISVGADSNGGATGNAYYSHRGGAADLSATAGIEGDGSSSLALSVRGGVTMTPYGVAAHRGGSLGGTRLMVDTNGIEGVPIGGTAQTRSNIFGKAVVADVSGYYRNSVSVDVNNLGDDIDVSSSVVQATLTEGAIGYRKFNVVKGIKSMAMIRLADGSSPPFSALVKNKSNHQTGVVDDDGSVWLSGINPNEEMSVSWDGKIQCHIKIPKIIPNGNLLLPCN